MAPMVVAHMDPLETTRAPSVMACGVLTLLDAHTYEGLQIKAVCTFTPPKMQWWHWYFAAKHHLARFCQCCLQLPLQGWRFWQP